MVAIQEPAKAYIETLIEDGQSILGKEKKDILAESLDLFCKKNISFADTFNASFMKAFQIKEVYSFDKAFDKIEGIKRLEPSLNNINLFP